VLTVPKYTDDAIEDLKGIRADIALYSPQLAAEKAALLDDTCNLLDQWKGMGSLFSGPLHKFVEDVWVIIYEPTAEGVLIHRVFNSRENWWLKI
jgi:plasmid stabilization system protein ParE